MAKSRGGFWQECTVPDGVYPGKWGGYVVEITVDGKNVRFDTDDGVRGMDIPVTVSVYNGVATVNANQSRFK